MAGKDDLLREIERVLAQHPKLTVTHRGSNDLEVRGLLAMAKWLLGSRRVEFSARIEVTEAKRTVVYSEMIREVGWGIPTIGGFRIERYKTDKKARSGSVREVAFGPQGKMIDYDWDYAQTRQIVQGIAAANGWDFTVVLGLDKTQH